MDQLGPQWEGMSARDVIRKINAQLHNRWRVTCICLAENVSLEMETPARLKRNLQHYEYGETLDEAVENAVRYSKEHEEMSTTPP